MNNINYTNLLVRALLQLMASIYNFRPSIRAYLKGADGWINFVQGFRTEDGSVRVALRAKDGKLSVLGSIPNTADSVIVFKDRETIMEAINLPPNELILFLLKGRMRIEGSLVVANLFNYYVSILMHAQHKKTQEKIKGERE